jgi:uncharacterized protein YjbI with pentapeptide repeats
VKLAWVREPMAMWWERIRKHWVWALVGVAAVLFVLWGGPWLFTRHPSSDLTDAQTLKAENDVRTTLVQAVGGIALALGLIVTYRTFRQNQRDQADRRDEQDRTYQLNRSAQVTDTYSKAVEQLGYDEAPVRLGALYSLVSLAQDNPPRRQIVVDVFCAYLRMPYTPPKQHAAESVSLAAKDSSPTPAEQAQEREREAAQELQVRRTAQRLLADHLRRPPDMSHEDAQRLTASPEEIFWPGTSLDLTGATLVNFNLSGISVIGATFTNATFSGDAWFNGVTFSGAARFDGATFSGTVWFAGATFSGAVWFAGATFSGLTWFGGATFSGAAWFAEVTFSGAAWFNRVTFSYAVWFAGVTFSGTAGFDGVTFSGAAEFDGVTFSGAAEFDGVTFSGAAGFDGVRVLHLDDPDLNKDGEDAGRVWPKGWTVRPDADDPTRGTLVPVAIGADNN